LILRGGEAYLNEWTDFQERDGWWARKSDNRVTTCSSAGTARRLKKDKVVKIPRLGGCKNFVGDREKLYI